MTMTTTRIAILLAFASSLALSLPATAQDSAAAPKRNVIIFVADGLRSGIVSHDTAPTFDQIRHDGVDFHNSHSLYPTVTTVNASAIATGHGIGDTGEWGNSIHFDRPVAAVQGAPAADMEDDLVLAEINGRYNNNYLNEVSLLRLARENGYATAAVGKEGPVLIQDIATANSNTGTVVIDDATGHKSMGGLPLDPAVTQAIKDAGLDAGAPDRGLNGWAGAYNMSGVHVANIDQQAWFVGVTTKVLLPRFVASGKPFALVYWSRDPDGTQHNNGDSLNTLFPGINGPTSLAAVRNASDNLQALIDSLKALGVYDNTDIFVTADHGFSTISRQSKTSWAAKHTYPDDTVPSYLPVGFVAMDLAHALNLPVYDSYGAPVDALKHQHASSTALIGADATHPDIIVAGAGGSEILYLDPAKAHDLAPRIAAAMTQQDYVGGLFVSDDLGPVKGALTFSQVGLTGTALTTRPAIYISLADHIVPACMTKWHNEELCSAMVVDGGLQQGQGNHGGFTRANTHNFMAAIGPDFKSGFVDPSPVSNADITPTLAHILGFDLPSTGALRGRVAGEALTGGPDNTATTSAVARSLPAASGFVTVLETQVTGSEIYLDAAGMPGRVIGLQTKK